MILLLFELCVVVGIAVHLAAIRRRNVLAKQFRYDEQFEAKKSLGTSRTLVPFPYSLFAVEVTQPKLPLTAFLEQSYEPDDPVE